MITSPKPAFALKLKNLRTQRGLSQTQVAEKLGTDFRVVSRWERGLHQPTAYYRPKLCELFGTPYPPIFPSNPSFCPRTRALVPPPGPGLLTVNASAPVVDVIPDGRSAVTFVELVKCVVSAVPFAAKGTAAGPQGYNLLAVVNAASPYQKLADLKGKKLAWVIALFMECQPLFVAYVCSLRFVRSLSGSARPAL